MRRDDATPRPKKPRLAATSPEKPSPIDPSRVWRVVLSRNGQSKVIAVGPGPNPGRWQGVVGTGVPRRDASALRAELAALVEQLRADGWTILEGEPDAAAGSIDP